LPECAEFPVILPRVVVLSSYFEARSLLERKGQVVGQFH
jgi:hypothetical protein